MDKQQVLIVDDSDSMRFVIKFCLENAGYQVFEARDGREGLIMAQSKHYDVIITDINMPNMDGYDFIAQTRKASKNQHVPILTLTTNTSVKSIAKGKAAGATGWLVKPFDDQSLLEVMRKVSS